MSMLRTMEKQGELQISPGAGRDSLPKRYEGLKNAGGRLANVPPARLLAMLRGENDGALHLAIEFPEERVHAMLEKRLGVPQPPKPAAAPQPDAEAPAAEGDEPARRGERTGAGGARRRGCRRVSRTFASAPSLSPCV